MSDHQLDHVFTEEEKQALLAEARNAIGAAVGVPPVQDVQLDAPVFDEKRGAFVTLHHDGALRGCIGFVLAHKPLIDTVREMAVAAAMRDPRFSPVDSRELPELDIEISVLSPLREIHDVEDIVVGEHGLYIQKGMHSGLLLPQVAEEYHWDRETFLQQTCRKAGLAENAWQDESTRIQIFSAQVFGER